MPHMKKRPARRRPHRESEWPLIRSDIRWRDKGFHRRPRQKRFTVFLKKTWNWICRNELIFARPIGSLLINGAHIDKFRLVAKFSDTPNAQTIHTASGKPAHRVVAKQKIQEYAPPGVRCFVVVGIHYSVFLEFRSYTSDMDPFPDVVFVGLALCVSPDC